MHSMCITPSAACDGFSDSCTLAELGLEVFEERPEIPAFNGQAAIP